MMDRKQIIQKIGTLLNDLNQSYEHINQTTGDINPLEIELFEVNSIYFAEHTKILTKLHAEGASPLVDTNEDYDKESANESAALVEEQTEPVEAYITDVEETFFTPKTMEDEAENESNIKQEEAAAKKIAREEKEPAASTESEPKADDGDKDDAETIADNEQRNAEQQNDERTINGYKSEAVREEKPKEEVKPTVSGMETVQEIKIEPKQVSIETSEPEATTQQPTPEPARTLSLNERISAQRQQLQTGYNQRPEMQQRIKDIKSTISLNDKLLFIKDLFNGYSLAYSEAIELLNRSGNFEDAHQFLQSNYAEKNQWSTKQATVDKLYAILKKRYGQF